MTERVDNARPPPFGGGSRSRCRRESEARLRLLRAVLVQARGRVETIAVRVVVRANCRNRASRVRRPDEFARDVKRCTRAHHRRAELGAFAHELRVDVVVRASARYRTSQFEADRLTRTDLDRSGRSRRRVATDGRT